MVAIKQAAIARRNIKQIAKARRKQNAKELRALERESKAYEEWEQTRNITEWDEQIRQLRRLLKSAAKLKLEWREISFETLAELGTLLNQAKQQLKIVKKLTIEKKS